MASSTSAGSPPLPWRRSRKAARASAPSSAADPPPRRLERGAYPADSLRTSYGRRPLRPGLNVPDHFPDPLGGGGDVDRGAFRGHGSLVAKRGADHAAARPVSAQDWKRDPDAAPGGRIAARKASARRGRAVAGTGAAPRAGARHLVPGRGGHDGGRVRRDGRQLGG